MKQLIFWIIFILSLSSIESRAQKSSDLADYIFDFSRSELLEMKSYFKRKEKYFERVFYEVDDKDGYKLFIKSIGPHKTFGVFLENRMRLFLQGFFHNLDHPPKDCSESRIELSKDFEKETGFGKFLVDQVSDLKRNFFRSVVEFEPSKAPYTNVELDALLLNMEVEAKLKFDGKIPLLLCIDEALIDLATFIELKREMSKKENQQIFRNYFYTFNSFVSNALKKKE